MSMIVAVFLSLAILVLSPTAAAKIMGLKGGIGKGAIIGFVALGLMQIIGRVFSFLPAGGILSVMGFLAAWYTTVKTVHGTDSAETMVFMFWQAFVHLLGVSLVMWLFTPSAVTWMWPG